MGKVLISGYYGFKNFGDEAILSVLINHLKSKNIQITVLSSNPEYTKCSYNVKAVNSFHLKKIINEIKNTDILISGGGSLLQDVTSLKSLVYYSGIITLAKIFNKKVIIFAQGIGPIRNRFAQLIVKNLLKTCDYISVRDENSLTLLKSWGINADLTCDPIYSIITTKKDSKNSVGIQLRDFKTMNYNLLQKLALLIVTKFSDKKIEIFSLQNSQDYEICQKFKTLLYSFNSEIETEIVTENIIDKISQLEYLIAMRFHALLVGIKCGIKSCAINYDIKVEKLAKDASIPIISMDAKENFEHIYQQLQEIKSENLENFCKNKSFNWEKIDKLLFSE